MMSTTKIEKMIAQAATSLVDARVSVVGIHVKLTDEGEAYLLGTVLMMAGYETVSVRDPHPRSPYFCVNAH